jgi:hypothetical protein
MAQKITITFSLDAETDRDLLRWLDRQDNRSEAIRASIRAHISGCVTLGDVYQAVRNLERTLKSGMVVQNNTSDDGDWDEPPAAAAALDALANL